MSSIARGVSDTGVLRPDRLPTFARLVAPDAVSVVLGHVWIPEWDLPGGVVLTQSVLAHPATNVVIQPGGSVVAGAGTRASTRDLAGRGWAVGLLLRPAGVEVLGLDPRPLVDAELPVGARLGRTRGAGPVRDVGLPGFEAVEAEVVALMSAAGGGPGRHARVLDAVVAWLTSLPEPSDAGLRANDLADLVEHDASVTTVEALAARLGVSARTTERLARRYVGTSPGAMVRRRRLQRAAARLREDPALALATVAAETGYSDQAHFTRDFRAVVGSTPSRYRAALG